MRRQQFEQADWLEPREEFQPVFALHNYMRDVKIMETHPIEITEAGLVAPVGFRHEPGSPLYNMTFDPECWDELEGVPRKTYQVLFRADGAKFALHTIFGVVSESFEKNMQVDWIQFITENGLHVPHEDEIQEFIALFGKVCTALQAQQS